jgi:hypothetical protein
VTGDVRTSIGEFRLAGFRRVLGVKLREVLMPKLYKKGEPPPEKFQHKEVLTSKLREVLPPKTRRKPASLNSPNDLVRTITETRLIVRPTSTLALLKATGQIKACQYENPPRLHFKLRRQPSLVKPENEWLI